MLFLSKLRLFNRQNADSATTALRKRALGGRTLPPKPPEPTPAVPREVFGRTGPRLHTLP
jgi:hypothetical protein